MPLDSKLRVLEGAEAIVAIDRSSDSSYALSSNSFEMCYDLFVCPNL